MNDYEALINLGEGIFMFMLSNMTFTATDKGVDICVLHPNTTVMSCTTAPQHTFCGIQAQNDYEWENWKAHPKYNF